MTRIHPFLPHTLHPTRPLPHVTLRAFALSPMHPCGPHDALAVPQKLTRCEWSSIRSNWGRPRRLSGSFLKGERQKLSQYRDKVSCVNQYQLIASQTYRPTSHWANSPTAQQPNIANNVSYLRRTRCATCSTVRTAIRPLCHRSRAAGRSR